VNAEPGPKALRAASAVSVRVVQTRGELNTGLGSSAGKCEWEAQCE